LFYKHRDYKENEPIPNSLIKSKIETEMDIMMIEATNFGDIKQKTLEELKLKRKEYKTIYDNLSVTRNSEKWYWISSNWLKKWIGMTQEDSDISPIDNSDILCEHGCVTLDITKLKRISDVSWDYLHKKYGGDLILSNEKSCVLCIEKEFFEKKTSNHLEEEKKNIMKLIDFHTYGTCYFVSYSWLERWKKTSIDKMDTLPQNINEEITCPHKCFIGNTSNSHDCTKVPEEAWNYFSTNFRHPDLVVHSTKNLSECDECSQAKLEEEQRVMKEERKRKKLKFNLDGIYKSFHHWIR